ncbi:MAG: cell division protein SepF [Thermoflexaceae bacterium]|nr:cell division protein SepF [Thermoflexaceae bacterium]
MANFLYKLLGMFSLTDDYDDDDEDFDEDDYEDEEEEETSRFKSRKKEKNREREKEYVPEPKPEKKSNVLPYSKKSSKNGGMAVCVIKPTTLEDGREISDTLLSGRAVVLNLEDVDGDMAQRIIDFTSGACYSIGGNLQKVSTFIFVVTPSSVDIAGDFQDLISSAAASSSSSASMQNRYRF